MAGGDRRACDSRVAGAVGAGTQFHENGRPTMGSSRSVGFHPKKDWHHRDRRRIGGLPACDRKFFFSRNSWRRSMGATAYLLDVRARGHVRRKNFSQRIIVAHRVDRIHVVSIGSATSAHQHSIGHGVSVRDGLVGDEPLLLPVAVPLSQHLRRTICTADSSPNTSRTARAALLVRRAVVGASFLASVFATRARGLDRACVHVAPFDSKSRRENFRGHVDDSLFVDGTHLSAFDNPRADSPLGILASFLDASLVRRSFGFPLGWDESRQLVRDARHDRRRVVFVGSSIGV